VFIVLRRRFLCYYLLAFVVVTLGGEILGPFRPVLRPILFAAVLGMAINALGMEYFLFRFDDSGPLRQVFWFCVMIFAPLGPALYCFVVYSRSDQLKNSADLVPRIHR